jgi:hypothetical protein
LGAQVAYGQQTQGDNSTSAAEFDIAKSVHIFPNPAVEYLNVKVEHVQAAKVKLTVHNILGNEMTIETEIVDEHELRVRVKDLATGYYLLAIKDDETKYRGTFKFLKRQ